MNSVRCKVCGELIEPYDIADFRLRRAFAGLDPTVDPVMHEVCFVFALRMAPRCTLCRKPISQEEIELFRAGKPSATLDDVPTTHFGCFVQDALAKLCGKADNEQAK